MALSSVAIEEKNKLSTDSLFLLAIQLTIPTDGEDLIIRFVRDKVDLTWRNLTWLAMTFEVDDISESSTGENPQLTLRIDNTLRNIRPYIEEYDIFCKNNGYVPIFLDFYCVNTKAITQLGQMTAPEVEHNFELLSPHVDARWVAFTFGAPNPWAQRFPRNRMMRNVCRYRHFKGTRCGVTTGNATKTAAITCDRTLKTCRLYGNSARFGGTLGVGSGGIYLEY